MKLQALPSVFLSYSHDSEAHLARVRELAERLIGDGIACVLDQYEASPPEGWPQWMDRQLDEADFVVVVCSEGYYRKAKADRHPTSGRGVKFESALVIQELYEAGMRNERFIPVLFEELGTDLILRPLRACTRYYVDRPDGYDALLRHLTAQPLHSKPELGPAQILPAAPRRSLARVSYGPTRLHDLARPPDDFTGRTQELAAFLKPSLATGSPVLWGLRGMAGVGKTTLALKLAGEIAAAYPDAQLTVDLKGITAPISPSQAMAQVIHAFQPELALPQQDEELASLYRSSLYGKSALLLLNDAAGRDQVEPLLPPASCALLVTSRFHFSLPGMVFIDLEQLPPPEAQAFLLRMSPRIGDAASELAHLCGGLPLALRLAGETLRDRRDLSPGDYIARLAAGSKRLQPPVEVALATSYELLAKDLRKFWVLLSVFPGSFDAGAAAALWQLDEARTDDLLGRLMASSLLEWSESSARYRLHDLARLFAGRKLDDGDQIARRRLRALRPLVILWQATIWLSLDRWLDEGKRAAAQRRYTSHYLQVLRRAGALGRQGGDGARQGLDLFDAERENVLAAQAWAAAQPLDDAAAAELCVGFPLTGPLGLRLQPRLHIVWLEAALRASRRLGWRTDEVDCLLQLGSCYGATSVPRRAIEFCEQALALASKLNDRKREAQSVNGLACAWEALGEHQRAISLLEPLLTFDRDAGDLKGEATTLGNMALSYRAMGNPKTAIELAERQLALSREAGNRSGEFSALGTLANCYLMTLEVRRAIDLYGQCIAFARELGDRRLEASNLGNLGFAHFMLGEDHQALDLHTQHLAIERELGYRQGEAHALANLANAQWALDEPRRAVDLLEKRLLIVREIENREQQATALSHLAEVYNALEEPRRALELLDQALGISRQLGDRDNVTSILVSLGHSHQALGESRRAFDLANEALRDLPEIENDWLRALSSWHLGVLFEKLGNPASAIDLMQPLVDLKRQIGALTAERDAAEVAAIRARVSGSGQGDSQHPTDETVRADRPASAPVKAPSAGRLDPVLRGNRLLQQWLEGGFQKVTVPERTRESRFIVGFKKGAQEQETWENAVKSLGVGFTTRGRVALWLYCALSSLAGGTFVAAVLFGLSFLVFRTVNRYTLGLPCLLGTITLIGGAWFLIDEMPPLRAAFKRRSS